jgi:hypothetical protein
VVCIGVLVFGVPLGTFVLLRSMRSSLFDEEHEEHKNTVQKYGSLYEQYEEEFYAWEVLVMLKKMALTGGLVLIYPGTSAQILFGALLALFYLLFLVRAAPFAENTDDTLEIFASLAILLTLLAGFALKTQSNEVGSTIYEDGLMSGMLIFINSMILAMGSFAMFMATPCMEGRDPTQCCHRTTEENLESIEDAFEEIEKKLVNGKIVEIVEEVEMTDLVL